MKFRSSVLFTKIFALVWVSELHACMQKPKRAQNKNAINNNDDCQLVLNGCKIFLLSLLLLLCFIDLEKHKQEIKIQKEKRKKSAKVCLAFLRCCCSNCHRGRQAGRQATLAVQFLVILFLQPKGTQQIVGKNKTSCSFAFSLLLKYKKEQQSRHLKETDWLLLARERVAYSY